MDAVVRALPVAGVVARLEAAFRAVQATRMQGMPIVHPGLCVEAVGFAAQPDGAVADGVLVTPWFMSLVRLPLHHDAAQAMLATGRSEVREWGSYAFDFIGGHEPSIGRYEACSLFSPMAEFADHDAAVATARAVLEMLRRDAAPAAPLPPEQPARRGFLFGRSAIAEGRR